MLLSFSHFYNIINSRSKKSKTIPKLFKVTISATTLLERKLIGAHNQFIVLIKYYMLD